MLTVGITGGIGSGKTTVCKIFATMGVPVYYADDAAKWLMENDQHLVAQIKEAFGSDAYLPDGRLNRQLLANVVFNNAGSLRRLESMVHPAVQAHAEQWIQQQTAPYILKEAALLFESGSYKQLHKIIVVYAPREVRLQRVQQRDNTTAEAVIARMNKQMPDEEKVKMADFIVYNNGAELLIPQVMRIHQQLLQLAKEMMGVNI
ncbi:dephospho-CoA kinase [Sphingobacteriales bacterium UPWRP_1]|nr:dephospho-CoA kinase [Sphingobacteriales bacterium TSM_CSS]PSJ73500.1 dephospho-CoA kinase [Sphingobacteriales bacterium UPWRP_1]